ncbi:MAG: NAD(P)-binding domain-containing protein [Actinomycetota bacterium]|jgi:3-hydroxyisobutyrate dehydrogenase-like beta-hydroxyacid dehydrogenase|nr:NAD(P)-binding domain-containing protein [Actinomycetota bacterium]MDA8280607.1 NAD(P)-binding domain-containing protein [Actinomycetota bacterium]
MRVSVLGTGRMGTAVARRLLDQGHQVTVWNRTAERTAGAVEAGATAAGNAAEAVAGADVTIMSLADDHAVLALVHDTVAAALTADGVLVDSSTVAPRTSRDVATAVGAERFVAAPILGAPNAVEDGAAVLLVGGPPATVERLATLWSDLAASHCFCGEDAGSATTLKVTANYLLLGGLAVLAEAVAMAEAAGTDPQVLQGFLRTSPLVPPAVHNRLDNLLASEHPGWFAPQLGAKDVRLAVALAHESGVNLPVAALVADRFGEAARRAGPDDDITAVVELLRHPEG